MPRTKNPDVKSSKYRGVSLLKSTGKWMAQYKHNGHTTYLGCFYTEVEAAYAYDDGKREAAANGSIPFYSLQLNFPERQNGYIYPKKIRPIREPQINQHSFQNLKNLSIFKCKGVTYYSARKLWKVSYYYNKTRFYVGAYSSQEDAIRSGIEYLELNRIKFDDDWTDKTIKKHMEVLERNRTLYNPEMFALPPLLFSRSPSPFLEINIEDLLLEESPSLDSSEISAPSIS